MLQHFLVKMYFTYIDYKMLSVKFGIAHFHCNVLVPPANHKALNTCRMVVTGSH